MRLELLRLLLFALLLLIFDTCGSTFVVVAMMMHESYIASLIIFNVFGVTLLVCICGHIALQICRKMLQLSSVSFENPGHASKLWNVVVIDVALLTN